MNITTGHLESLAAKLNGLELTPEEKVIFGHLVTDPQSEVEGFAKRIYVGNLPLVQGFNIGMPPALAETLKLGEPPTQP